MLKSVFQILLLVVVFSWIQLPKAYSSDFLGISSRLKDLNYKEGYGLGMLDHLELFFSSRTQSIKKFQTPQRVEVFRQGNDFNIKLDFFALDWKKVPKWIGNIEELNVHEIDGHLGTDKNHFIKLESLDVTSKDDWLKGSISNLDLYCLNNSPSISVEKKLLTDCMKLGSLKIESVDYPFQLKFWQPITEEIKEETDEDISRVMEDIELNFNEGNFDLKIKTKILFKIRIKVLGHLDVDLAKKEIIMRLDQARIGIIPVTGLVFRELKKRLTSSNIVVDPPYIKIQLK